MRRNGNLNNVMGTLDDDRRRRAQLEQSNYSIQGNFDIFAALIKKPNKHIGDMEMLRRFILNVPYLKHVSLNMANRRVDLLLNKLILVQYVSGCIVDSEDFHIILSGEVLKNKKSLVQSDTFLGSSECVTNCQALILKKYHYDDLLAEYNEQILQDKIKFIQSIQAFSSISSGRIKNMLDNFEEIEHNIGTIIYKEDSKTDYVYLILAGEVLISQKLQLQLCGMSSIFGEYELIENRPKRIHRAVVTQSSKFYRITFDILKGLLHDSNTYESFQKQFKQKKQFWQIRIKENTKTIEPVVDYSEFKHVIPRHYHNYISVTKLKKKKNDASLNEQLQEARKERLQQLIEQFHCSIKKNMKSNYNLRKMVMQAKKEKRHTPFMDLVQVDEFVRTTPTSPRIGQSELIRKQLSTKAPELNQNEPIEQRVIYAKTRTHSTATQTHHRMLSASQLPSNRIISRPQTGIATPKRLYRVQSKLHFRNRVINFICSRAEISASVPIITLGAFLFVRVIKSMSHNTVNLSYFLLMLEKNLVNEVLYDGMRVFFRVLNSDKVYMAVTRPLLNNNNLYDVLQSSKLLKITSLPQKFINEQKMTAIIGVHAMMGVILGYIISQFLSERKIQKPAMLRATPLVSFKNIYGLDNAKHQLSQVISYLKNPAEFQSMGARLRRGVLIYGPPGTGKTMLAKATASESQVKFLYVSATEFIEIYVGTGPKRVRELFKTARQQAPAIVFIDEIDSVAYKRRNENLGQDQAQDSERINTLNQLLIEMDGFRNNDNVVVIAATNRMGVLDDAIMRSGRFDIKIEIHLPNEKERLGIMQVHLEHKQHLINQSTLQMIANKSQGYSGADMETITNESAYMAIEQDQMIISDVHITQAFEKMKNEKQQQLN